MIFASVSAGGRVCRLFFKKRKEEKKKGRSCLQVPVFVCGGASIAASHCESEEVSNQNGGSSRGVHVRRKTALFWENVARLSIQTTPDKGQLNPQFVPSGPPATWLVEGFGPNLAPTVMTWTSSVVEGVWGGAISWSPPNPRTHKGIDNPSFIVPQNYVK